MEQSATSFAGADGTEGEQKYGEQKRERCKTHAAQLYPEDPLKNSQKMRLLPLAKSNITYSKTGVGTKS